ncbi:PhzF family phenazine biosynthesis protein [Pseudomonas sp. HMWF032]|uniref:PhzF family phenazine biosynthesis protein n=1 Tax=Pseudomonas sp. HMWF032 TaxID=2056866 RepID=UPI000D3437DA|nr:PhzF family phenazine biosynthesis protein [Pseudomonas sp. HMWF032]PTS85297.1 PhzF family phenazine biosynthesis protein [Pseudomonas sp. HMWF032]PTT84761.1 PhzF family phenazine biosynthesis protein [Pseudomonas sp. HMWF010]
MSPVVYWQLDVFAERPLAGNGVAVFPDARQLDPAVMQALTRELRQFESIFLLPGRDPQAQGARIFTMEEELPFAGHPILGAAALLHHLQSDYTHAEWTLQLAAKSVRLLTRRQERGFYAQMDQGAAEFGAQLSPAQAQVIAEAFNLNSTHLDHRYPARVISTGLPYLILPVSAQGLALARQQRMLDAELASHAAAFVFLLDMDNREGRTWDPLGVIEDIATGSAAGPVAAFLVEHGLHRRAEHFSLNQGRFLGRPSRLDVCVGSDDRISVGGSVQLLARAELWVDPRELA